MMTYSFKNLLEDLRTGREVEFVYDSDNYSITNNQYGWQFCCNNSVLIRSCKTVTKLIEKLSCYQIKNQISINEVFNNSLYDEGSLYVLF